MYKKLLFLIAINCAMVQAAETQMHENNDVELKEKIKALFEKDKRFGKKEDVLALYKEELSGIYRTALAKALAGEEGAIEQQSKENELANKKDEEDKKQYFDDSKAGYWWSTPASPNSVKGCMEAEWAGTRKDKDQFNAEQLKEHQVQFNSHKKNFNENVIPVLKQEMGYILYEMENTFYRGLERCGTDKECLLIHNVPWPLTEEFLDGFIKARFSSVIQEVKKHEIPLSDEQVVMIARKKTFLVDKKEVSLASAEEWKKRVIAKVHDLLHPKKNDEMIFGDDVNNDQNDQGALSQ